MKKKYKIIILLLIIIIGVISCLYIYIYSKTKKWTTLVYPGVKIGQVDISGKTLIEAKDMITTMYVDVILKKNITIKTPMKTYSLDYTKINAKYNIDEVIKESFDYGKDLNLYERYKLLKNPVNKVINLQFVYDPKTINQLISNMKKDIDKDPKDASISLVYGKFKITPDEKGSKLLDEKLEREILSKINGDIASPNIVVNAEIEPILSNITQEKLLAVNTKLSSFSSDFTTSPYGRSTNITLATDCINGTLIMPGQSFSFNGKVGQRTSAKGYQPAPVDIGTKVGTDYGGGICQVSTSLYNTVMRANIKSTVRNHHSIPSTYVPLGMDATVDWPSLDYQFTNTLAYPIFIESMVKNKVLTFNIYSNSSLNSKTYNMVNDIYETTIPGPATYIDDITLPIGQVVQDQFPLTGYKVKTYKDTIENNIVTEHQLISDDTYKMVAEVIKRGTKK